MRRTIFIISALAGALGAATPALAQSDDLPGDDEYPADDMAAPAEEAAGSDYTGADDASYDDAASYGDDGSYDDASATYADPASYDDSTTYGEQPVSLSRFQRELSPYGRWVRTPEYGLVWIPSRQVVGADFVPYATGGSWRYSDVGWTFVTPRWRWGWAPFHYGRWYRAPGLGWVWIPGSRWAPAWVDWRYGSGYVGWAPLPPRRFAAALGYHDYWFFCSVRDMWRPHVWRYRVRSNPNLFRVALRARRPFVRGRVRWFAGPSVRVVERAIRRPVDRVHFRSPRQRVERRVMPRQERVQRLDRPQRVERQRRVERQQPVRLDRQRQNQMRVERQNQMRVERQNQMRVERQNQMREQRQNQVREQRQNQRVQRQQMREQRPNPMREQRQQQRVQLREERRVQRQQAREQRHQPTRERRRRPDR
jgi:hypothetical protein